MNKTAERIRKEINEQKINRVSSHAPPDMDHVQPIDIDEEKATVRDKDGNELCRFYVTIAGRRLFFKFPTYDKYNTYLKKFAELARYLSRSLPEVLIDESNTELFKNPIAKSLWVESTGIALSQSKRVKELIIDIFFNTLGVYVEDMPVNRRRFETENMYENRVTKAHLKWFKRNATMDKIQHVMYACFAVDELIKKKATLGIIMINPLLPLLDQCSENTSAKPPVLTPTASAPTPYSLLKLL